ncbi:ribose-phosphate pyrophosphokinase [bacterium]|nr:ribose-phosphate pyrophosphokinase [candidate division CSSED10-310 bacterium]
MKVLFGTAHTELGREICAHLGVNPVDVEIRRFKDGEVFVQIQENIRGRDVFLVQPTCSPANENLMELLIMLDAAKRASAKRITAVLPYYGYARQDRKDRPRVPITARLVADLLTTAGADRVMAIDLHAGQIQGFFNIPFDHLYATPVFLEYIQNLPLKDELMVVSPDAGGVERANFLARCLGVRLAVADKRRISHNEAESIQIIGNVSGKSVLILDDIIDTAGTLMKAVDALKDAGATRIMCCATHGVFSSPALERIERNMNLDEVIVTNTISHQERIKNNGKIRVLSIAHLLADAMQCIHTESSVSSLFVIRE